VSGAGTAGRLQWQSHREKYLLELTDGLLAHRHVDANGRGYLPTAIHFSDDREGDYGRGYFPWHMFWGAWKWTGDKKYLTPIVDGGMTMSVNANALDILNLRKDTALPNIPAEGGRRGDTVPPGFRPGARAAGFRGSSGEHFAWQADGDKSHLERLYAQQIESCATNEYIETEGSLGSTVSVFLRLNFSAPDWRRRARAQRALSRSYSQLEFRRTSERPERSGSHSRRHDDWIQGHRLQPRSHAGPGDHDRLNVDRASGKSLKASIRTTMTTPTERLPRARRNSSAREALNSRWPRVRRRF